MRYGLKYEFCKSAKGGPFWSKKFFSSFRLKMIGNGQKMINIEFFSDFDPNLVFYTALNAVLIK